jgi:hypothetical protein
VGSLSTIFQALQASIATEVARPANADGSGGTSFPVEVVIGHEEKPKFPGAGGRVVLSLGEDGAMGGPKVMNGRLRTLCTWTPTLEASLWAPVGQAGTRTAIGRLDAIEALVKCVGRAIYADNHGSNMPDAPPIESASVSTDPAVMRHGEHAIVRFTVGIPITKGRGLTQASPGGRLAVTMNVNPET